MRGIVVLGAALALGLFAPGTASGGDFDFATGESKGHIQVAVTARETTTAGEYRGRIKLQQEAGKIILADVTCLSVVSPGPTYPPDPQFLAAASVRGEVIRSSYPGMVGDPIEVELYDGGKANPGHQHGPDKVEVIFDPPPPFVWDQGSSTPDCIVNTPPKPQSTRDGNVEIYDAPA